MEIKIKVTLKGFGDILTKEEIKKIQDDLSDNIKPEDLQHIKKDATLTEEDIKYIDECVKD